MCFFPLAAVGEPLGRLDYASMSEQAKMEMLVDAIHDKDVFQDTHGNYLDLQSWRGVSLDTDDHVRAIRWCNLPGMLLFANGGSVAIEWLPPAVQHLTAFGTKLHGSIETELLPREMVALDVVNNLLCGSFALASLPQGLVKIYISLNKFSGSLELAAIPRNVVVLEASGNLFSGSISLASLPPHLETLSLGRNKIVGSLSLDSLPASLTKLDVHGNAFQQRTLVIPDEALSITNIWIRGSGISEVVDAKGAQVRGEQIDIMRHM